MTTTVRALDRATLQAELGLFTAGGHAGDASPDRADAMIWALWALCLKERAAPRIRTFD